MKSINSNNKRSRLNDTVAFLSCAIALAYGLCAFTAPSYFFAPRDDNTLSPFIKTSLESNALDPITQHYMKTQGICILALILSYYLFAYGDYESERCFITSFQLGHVAQLAVYFKAMQNEELYEYYKWEGLTFTLIWSAVHLAFFQYVLMTVLKKKDLPEKKLPVPPNIDTAIFYVGALHLSLHCVSQALFGPDRLFFPHTPLPDDTLDPIMDLEGRIAGVWFIPAVYMLVYEAQALPRLVYKTMILWTLLGLPVIIKLIQDEVEYANKNAFGATVVLYNILLGLAFYRLGAFDKENTEEIFAHVSYHEKIVKHDDGMELRDGRVISYKPQ